MLLSTLIADIPPETTEAAGGESSSSWGVIVAVVAGVALGLVLIGWFVRRRKPTQPAA